MRTIKLMADYGSFPLWEASPGEVGNIDPDDLPLSAALRQRLAEWARDYDATLNIEDPARSGFKDDASKARFKMVGAALADDLQAELGPSFSIKVRM